MSRPVDEKIVKMTLDNTAFMSKISATLGAMGNLTNSFKGIKNIDLASSVRSLGNVQDAASKVDMSKISAGVENVSSKFSALSAVALGAFASIGAKAASTAMGIINSFTMAPMLDGFREYETKMGSIQTILANTSRYGTTLKDVTGALGELNDYADKTIYSFADMTKNVGLFTNSGMRVEDATSVIKGFSNEAAASGTTAQSAANAAYQLSQALSAGTVRLMDWRSLTNAGMGNKNMQNGLIEIASAMGALNEAGISAETIQNDFNSSLESNWLSADVMSTYLKIMARETTAAEMAAMGLTDAQIAMFEQQALTAEDAATKIRTFSQLMGTVKEALGSGWTETWELIFGGFDEATVLFSAIGNTLTTFAGAVANSRNEFLKSFNDMGGRTKVLQGLLFLFQGIKNLIRPIGDAFRSMFPPATGQALYEFAGWFEWLAWQLEYLTRTIAPYINIVFVGFFGILKGGLGIVKTLGGFLLNLIPRNLIRALAETLRFITMVSEVGATIVKSIIPTEKLGAALEKFGGGIVGFAGLIREGLEKPLQAFGDVMSNSAEWIDKMLPEWETAFKGIVTAVETFVSNIHNKFLEILPVIVEVFQGAKQWVKNFVDEAMPYLNLIIPVMVAAFSEASKWVQTFAKNAVDWITEIAPTLSKFFSDMGKWAEDFIGTASTVIANFVGEFVTWITGLAREGVGMFQTLIDWVKKFGGVAGDVGGGFKEKFGSVFEFLGTIFSTIWDIIRKIKLEDVFKVGAISGFVIFGKKVLEILDTVIDFIKDLNGEGGAASTLDTIADSLKSMSEGINVISIFAIAASVGILVLSMKMLEGMNSEDISKGLATIALSLVVLVKALGAINGNGLNVADTLTSIALLMTLGIAILILSTALKILSDIDSDKMAAGTAGLVAIVLSLVGSLSILSGQKVKIATSASFVVGMAIAVKIIAGAVKDIAEIDSGALLIGVAAVGVILLELAAFMVIADSTKINPMSAVSLMIVVGAVKMMTSSITKLGEMNVETLKQGLAALGLVLFELAAFAFITSDTQMLGTAVALIAVAAGVKALIEPITTLGDMNIETLKQGLLGLAIALGAIAMVMLSSTAGGGFGILAVAVAMTLLVPPLVELGNMDLEVLAIGLGAMAVAFLIIGGAAYVIGSASIPILAFAEAIALIGVGIGLVGIGLLAFAAGLVAVAGISAAAIAAIFLTMKAFIEGLISLIPAGIELIKTFFSKIFNAIEEGLPGMIDQGYRILKSIIVGLSEHIDELTEMAVNLVIQFAEAIGKNAGPLLEAAVQLMTDLINGLSDTLREKGPELITAVLGFIESILEIVIFALIEVIRLLFGWIPGVESAMDTAGSKATEALRTAFDIAPVGTERGEELAGAIEAKGPRIRQAGEFIGNEGKEGAGTPDWTPTGTESGTQYGTGIESTLPYVNAAGVSINTSGKKGAGSGSYNPEGSLGGTQYTDGLLGKKQSSYDAGASLNSQGRTGATATTWNGSGEYLGEGLAVGIEAKGPRVANAAATLGGTATMALAKSILQNSPSKVTIKSGKFFGEGFAIGIADMGDRVKNRASEMAKGAIAAVQSYASAFSDELIANMELSPKITPVLDLGNVSDFSFGSQTVATAPVSIRANTSGLDDFANTLNRHTVEYNVNMPENDMIKAIDDLANKVDQMSQAPITVEIDVDGKRITRELASPMRKEFERYDANQAIITKGRR